jgi:hypothetical protein
MTGGAAPEPAVHLGLVAYVWGALHQDRLLVECLAPAVEELRRQGLARRFWVDRFDARGPHVFAVLTLPREAAPEIGGRLADRLGGHLAAHPSSVVLTADQLARRHQEVRQKRQCEVDGRPGFAANNSFEIFEHPPRGYPFSLSASLAGEEDLWDLVADLCLWAIGRLAARPGSPAMAAALLWAASMDRELHLAGVRPADSWRHHARTLVPDLFDRLGPEETDAALAELSTDVGTKNPAFGQAWQEVAGTGPVWPRLPDLVRLLGVGPAFPPDWRLLREINHTLLKQLGIPVALHLPLVLYAWRRIAG